MATQLASQPGTDGSQQPSPLQPALDWRPYPPIPGWAEAGITGTLFVTEVDSPQLGRQRQVTVYLPASYDGERRYSVLYLQDGQNLYDPAVAFGGQTWRVGETLTRLAADKLEAIVVAPYHGDQHRIQEYNPFPQWRHGQGEAYVQFLVDTLKPRIDHDFHTEPGPQATVIAGSSMGGLISLYALLTRPDVFGRAGAMSPSLWVAHGAIYQAVLKRGRVPGARLYVDNGTREPSAQPLVDLLLAQGYQPGADLLYVSGRGHRHTESAWARRLPGALRFLLR